MRHMLKETIKTKTATRRTSVEVLRSIYADRKAKNEHYSLNAFARDLGLSRPLVSRILSGARSLTLKQGMHIAAVLGFTQSETNLFLLGIVEAAASTAKISKKIRETIQNNASAAVAGSTSFESPLYVNYDVERFKTIAQWYHVAIMNLTFTEGFNTDVSWIAGRLGISVPETRSAVDRLLELGFLEETLDGSIRKSQANLYFKTEKSEVAIREHHSQMIEKAQAELKKTDAEDFARRLINSITFSCDPSHLALFQKKINEFQDEVLALAKTGNHQDVYQLNCQLFPLTKKQREKSKRERKEV
jgi:uncharacterized protein (TIGR02147 family)